MVIGKYKISFQPLFYAYLYLLVLTNNLVHLLDDFNKIHGTYNIKLALKFFGLINFHFRHILISWVAKSVR